MAALVPWAKLCLPANKSSTNTIDRGRTPYSIIQYRYNIWNQLLTVTIRPGENFHSIKKYPNPSAICTNTSHSHKKLVSRNFQICSK